MDPAPGRSPRTARRGVHGTVVLQRTEPGWFDTIEPSEREHDGIRRVVREVHRHGPRVDVVIDYHIGDRTWTHAFSRYPVERELEDDLASVRLGLDRWLSDDHTWFTARPGTG